MRDMNKRLPVDPRMRWIGLFRPRCRARRRNHRNHHRSSDLGLEPDGHGDPGEGEADGTSVQPGAACLQGLKARRQFTPKKSSTRRGKFLSLREMSFLSQRKVLARWAATSLKEALASQLSSTTV